MPLFVACSSGHVRTEAIRKLYGNRAISVQLPCSHHKLSTKIVQNPCGFRAEAVRRCYDVFCCTISARPPNDVRAGVVQCHLRQFYGLRTYDFSNLYNSALNKIVEAAEPVKSYKNLTVASCFRTAAARKWNYGLDTGSVDAS